MSDNEHFNLISLKEEYKQMDSYATLDEKYNLLKEDNIELYKSLLDNFNWINNDHNNTRTALSEVRILSRYDEQTLATLNDNLIAGRLPTKENEILIPSFMQYDDVKVGSTFNLAFGANQTCNFYTVKIVGIYESDVFLYSPIFINENSNDTLLEKYKNGLLTRMAIDDGYLDPKLTTPDKCNIPTYDLEKLKAILDNDYQFETSFLVNTKDINELSTFEEKNNLSLGEDEYYHPSYNVSVDYMIISLITLYFIATFTLFKRINPLKLLIFNIILIFSFVSEQLIFRANTSILESLSIALVFIVAIWTQYIINKIIRSKNE